METLLEDICFIHMESGFNQNQILVCWYTERESIKLQSDCLIINLVIS